MPPAANTLHSLAVDTQGLDALRFKARNSPGESATAVSKQFEAMFLGMVMKGMRAATPQEGAFENEQTRLYTSMLDQQLAQHMAKRGTGLAEVMARQLAPSFADGIKPGMSLPSTLPEMPAVSAPPVAASPPASAVRGATPVANSAASQPPGDFVKRVWAHAVDAAKSLGVQPQFIVGQAALESGWGKHEIRTADGQPSHNLFGIKASSNWKGPSVEKTTLEYVNGVAVKTSDRFRVYASYTESFRDYANLLRDNARYAGVIGQNDARGFAQGLQRGGYATDPAYAEKLVSIINSARDLAVPKAPAEAPAVFAAAAGDAPVPAPSRQYSMRDYKPAVYVPDAASAGGLVRAAYQASGPAPAPAAVAVNTAAPQQAADFVGRVWPHAVQAAQALGLQPQFIVGQAALETGWGKYEIRDAAGQPSHNLFGIRAGSDWQGPTVEKTATAYVKGVATQVVEKYRVYASYSEGFNDYVALLRDNPRYAATARQADARGYAQGLQRAGYAADPAYADKLVRVINSPPIQQVLATEARPQVLARR